VATSSIGAVGGSSIDAAGLAKQLVAAERAPLDTQIKREASRVTTQLSALGSLMGSMSLFRSALSSLKTEDVFSTRQATSAKPEVFTATASASAVPGSYNVEVVQLAKAQQIASTPFAGGGTEVVGTGTLTLSLGALSVNVTVDSSNSTLAGIRDAINDATGNPGISATLIQSTAGSRLVLTSAETGESNAIVVAQSGGDGGLARLAYSASSTANYTQLAAAQDAIVKVATFTSRSASNTLTNVIDGVTLNLEAASSGESFALDVSYDKEAVTTRINSFVSAYNALQTQISKLRSYDSLTKTAGPLLGDSLLAGIESQMRRTVSGAVSGAGDYQTLASVGIKTDSSGNLVVDSSKLDAALSGNFGSVAKLFGSDGGVGAKLFSQIDERLKSNGAIDTRSANLARQQKVLEDRQSAVDARMEVVLQRYVKQFTTLDNLLSSLQTTSAYLTQQLASLPGANSN
jgi:flagellar hook-associated protein 2